LANTRSADQALLTKYRRLTQGHLNSLLKRLFAEFTGLHFRIAWAPPTPEEWSARALPTGCSTCCRLAGTRLGAQPICGRCGARQLARALATDGEGHRFLCRLGVWNYWLPVRVRGVTLGIVYLQALSDTEGGHARRVASGDVATEGLSGPQFRRAGRLLRLIVQHVQALDLAVLREEDLTKALQALSTIEQVEARLRQEPPSLLSFPGKARFPSPSGSRAERIVQALLSRIHHEYAQALTLKKCARDLKINAAYLSHLFSQAVGLSFKAYLTGFQVQKAQELLEDAANTITQVAAAVGFASENRFRSAFKRITGMPPRQWRDTLRVPAPGS
jgi:AraC-like DNA-binding protein